MKELHDLRDMLCDELKEYAKKGELSAGSLSTIDTLAHALKNIDKVIEDDDGYSSRYPYMGNSYDDRHYSRRYSRRYSRNDLSDKLRELMNDATDEHTRHEMQRMIDKLDA